MTNGRTRECLAGACTLALAAVLVASCSGGGKDAGPTVPVTPAPVLTTVTVSLSPSTIQVGQSATATAAGLDQNGATASLGTVTWSSGAPGVATVSVSGAVSGVSSGQALITATSGGKSGTSAITVLSIPVSSVTVAPSSDTLLVGQSQTLQATPKSAVGTALTDRTITWSSSDTIVASVTSSGTVGARKAGAATITATSEGIAGSAQFTIGSNVPVITISGPATATRTGWASSTPITVQVRDAFSRPVTRASLNWSLPASGGWLFPAATITAADGSANASWIAGTVAGVVTVTAIANGGSAQAVGTYAVSVLPTPQYNAINTYFDVSGGSSAAGFRVDVTPLSEPAGTYYAAIQWNGGYMGIQRGGSLFDRQLQFSAWNNAAGDAAVIDSASSHLRCSVFGGEGTGVACSLSYPWQIGRSYRFETQFTPSTQGTLIDGWVTSLSDGTRTHVGRIRQAGALSQASFTTFVEDFAGNAPHCLANQLRSYRVASPQALLGGTWTVLPTAVVYPYAPTTACANVNFVVANGGLEISLGAPVPRNPSVPIPVVVQMP